MNQASKKFKLSIIQSLIVILSFMAIIGTVFCADAFAEEANDPNSEVVSEDSTPKGYEAYALIASSAAFGLGAIGAGLAISHVGAAAMGAVAEKPEIAGQALIFVALAEGIVVFGFITALMILGKM